MIDPSDGLLLAMMRERAQRAEQAAASSIKHMMEYDRRILQGVGIRDRDF